MYQNIYFWESASGTGQIEMLIVGIHYSFNLNPRYTYKLWLIITTCDPGIIWGTNEDAC